MERLVIMLPVRVKSEFEKAALKNRTTMSDALRDLICDHLGLSYFKVKKGRPRIDGIKSRKKKV